MAVLLVVFGLLEGWDEKPKSKPYAFHSYMPRMCCGEQKTEKGVRALMARRIAMESWLCPHQM